MFGIQSQIARDAGLFRIERNYFADRAGCIFPRLRWTPTCMHKFCLYFRKIHRARRRVGQQLWRQLLGAGFALYDRENRGSVKDNFIQA